jgi:hypothetical protein
MEKRDVLFPDKPQRFGHGPWLTEPDRIEWRSEHGFVCLMHRNTMGAWCGYVGVEPGHPWHGQRFDEIAAGVHGGLTYAAGCAGHICHVPEPGEPEHLYWLGFDAGHAFDLTPGMSVISERFSLFFHDAEYRDEAYVRAEVEKLAQQARAALEGGGRP